MTTLIKNDAINDNVKAYWEIYVSEGGIEFELTPGEYEALGTIIKSYYNASLEKSFDGVDWARDAGARGLFLASNAAHVFNLLMLAWHTNVDISTRTEDDWVIFSARCRSLKQT